MHPEKLKGIMGNEANNEYEQTSAKRHVNKYLLLEQGSCLKMDRRPHKIFIKIHELANRFFYVYKINHHFLRNY